MTGVLRVANCSGFFGDRLCAAREMVTGGPIDVLTGDWLAELTMGVLLKQRTRDPQAGYAGTFVAQMRDVLGECLDRGIRVVSNAGGLNPQACAAEVEAIGAELGRPVRVAVVSGDDAGDAFRAARATGWPAPHLDTGEPMTRDPAVASAYLGCWGIAEALAAGADVVVTGRVSDASVVVGPAAWHFGWRRDDWDALAGAVVAGHVIECGAQATGGNYSFVHEIPDMTRPGFPLAEIAADGSAVITKHPGTGGAVTVGTVTAQLLYEIDGPRYVNPDVVARFDTITLSQEGPDRVRVSGVRGEPAPGTVKVGALAPAGWRNKTTFVLTGLDIEDKAELAQRQLWDAVPGGRDAFDDVVIRLVRADRPDPATMLEAAAFLTVAVASNDRQAVARFSRAAVETALGGYPGLFLSEPPGPGSEFAIFWPTLMPASSFPQLVRLGERTWTVAPLDAPSPVACAEPPGPPPAPSEDTPTRRVPLGTVAGARSGDKAGNATLGLWTRDDAAYAWLATWLTEERLRALLPAAAGELRRWWLPNLRAAGATVVGLLGAGVAANLDMDAQAKGLGEFVRARHVDVPEALLRD